MATLTSKSELSSEDYEFCRQVAEDLRHVTDAFGMHMTADEARRESGVLRRLLCDGAYERAWHLVSLPGAPLLSVVDLDGFLGQVDRTYLKYAFVPALEDVSGQAISQTMRIPTDVEPGDRLFMGTSRASGGIAIWAVPKAISEGWSARDENWENDYVAGIGERRWCIYPVKEMLDTGCAIIDGHVITRGDLFTFIANWGGGVHTGGRRPRNPRRLKSYELLERSLALTYQLPAPFLELASTGTSLGRSTDVCRYVAEFDKLRPPAGRLEHEARAAK